MKIGVLGSGGVAQALAAGFIKHGHQVTVGSRSPEKLAEWAGKNPGVKTGNFADAAAFGEFLVLAVKGFGAEDALQLAGEENLAGKTIADATNPIADAPPDHGVLQMFTSPTLSLMEQLQSRFPAANFVKVFNCVGAAFMVNPQFPGGPPTMFIAGASQAAKKRVTAILDQFGWETADMGGAESARAIEPLCMLWCLPGFLNNQWTHAFKLLKI
jgi:predicted dinucleotide-binding enzyme